MTLHEAIEQLVNLGEKDPHEIAKKLRERHGDRWMSQQAALLADDVATNLARQMLGSRRRTAQLVVPAPQRGSWGELLLTAKWVPNVGWKRIGDLTADDCSAVASHYRVLTLTASRQAPSGGWQRELG